MTIKVDPDLKTLCQINSMLHPYEVAHAKNVADSGKYGDLSGPMAAVEVMIGRVTGMATLYKDYPFKQTQELMELFIAHAKKRENKKTAYLHLRMAQELQAFVQAIKDLNSLGKLLEDNPDLAPWDQEIKTRSS